MSSTIWNNRPSSSPNARHGAWSRSGTSAAHNPTPTDAAKRHPVFSRWSVASSGAVSVMSRYWPPIIPSVAGEDAHSLAVAGPGARPPAALRVVVQGRQVVVGERERVHELERGRSRERRLRLGPGRLGGREADDGPDALARLERVANGLLERPELGRQREVA